MCFQVQYAITLPNEIWAVNNEYRFVYRSVIEERLHVFRIEPQAPIGRCKADAGRFIGAMDQITRFAQIECVFSQGIFRPRRDGCGENIPFLGVSGRIKLRGNVTRSPASGTHISTPGFAALIALIPKLKCRAISGSVSPFSSLITANRPMTSSPRATGNLFRSISFS